MKNLLIAASIVGFTSISMIACQKDDDTGNGNARLQVLLTDAPANYDAVNVDIQSVMINVSNDTAATDGWKELPLISPGVYNLLDFQNGIDTVLADAMIPAGKIGQIRLVLGENNTVVIDGTPFILKTPSGQQSGLKLKVNQDIDAGIVYRMYIDFDANRSVVSAGNSGQYILKPVIRAFMDAVGGSVKGWVLPGAAAAQVWAIKNTDTLLALPDAATGYYFFGGLDQGTWQLEFDATNVIYQDTSFTVDVNSGSITEVDTVNLHQP